MKVFLINLDKNADRLAFMDGQLRRMGIEYERIPAIYGAALTEDEKRNRCRLLRSRIAKGAPMTDGEIGCALTHCGIYRRMVADNTQAALILEDDVILSKDFPAVLSEAADYIDPIKKQVVVFSDYNVPFDKRPTNGIVKTGKASCADAYIITLPAASCVLAANTPVKTVADAWTRWSKRYGIDLYRAFPTTVQQENERFGTDIDTWTRDTLHADRSCHRSPIGKVLRYARRAFEKTLDWTLLQFGL